MVIWAEFDAMGWARGVAALLSSHLRYVKVQRKFSDAMGRARGVAALLSSHLRYVEVQRKFSGTFTYLRWEE